MRSGRINYDHGAKVGMSASTASDSSASAGEPTAGLLSEAFVTDSPIKPVPCDTDPERWFPELDEASFKYRRSFTRYRLPELARACRRCHFRITCAVVALETQANHGVWAGVLVADYPGPGTWHRKKLLAILAEFVAESLGKNQADIDPDANGSR